MALIQCVSCPKDFPDLKEFYQFHKGDGIESIPDDTLKKWVNHGEILFLRGGLHPPLAPSVGVGESKEKKGASVSMSKSAHPILTAGHFTNDPRIPLKMISSLHPVLDQCVCITDNGPTLQIAPFNDAENICKLLAAPETLTSYVGSLIVHKEYRTENLMRELMKFYIADAHRKLTQNGKQNFVQCFALYRDRGLPWLWNKYVSYLHDGLNSSDKLFRWHCASFSNPERIFFVLAGTEIASSTTAIRSRL